MNKWSLAGIRPKCLYVCMSIFNNSLAIWLLQITSCNAKLFKFFLNRIFLLLGGIQRCSTLRLQHRFRVCNICFQFKFKFVTKEKNYSEEQIIWIFTTFIALTLFILSNNENTDFKMLIVDAYSGKQDWPWAKASIKTKYQSRESWDIKKKKFLLESSFKVS